jgi:hypothetical protein
MNEKMENFARAQILADVTYVKISQTRQMSLVYLKRSTFLPVILTAQIAHLKRRLNPDAAQGPFWKLLLSKRERTSIVDPEPY